MSYVTIITSFNQWESKYVDRLCQNWILFNWSLLHMTGYLKIDSYQRTDQGIMCI